MIKKENSTIELLQVYLIRSMFDLFFSLKYLIDSCNVIIKHFFFEQLYNSTNIMCERI